MLQEQVALKRAKFANLKGNQKISYVCYLLAKQQEFEGWPYYKILFIFQTGVIFGIPGPGGLKLFKDGQIMA